MICHVARYKKDRVISWGVIYGNYLYAIEGHSATTGDFIAHGREKARALAQSLSRGETWSHSHRIDAVKLLSPVTKPCQIVCQGINYRDHIIESGGDPDRVEFNTVFSKSSASITGPTSPIYRPKHVRLLDYEIELGLVIGQPIGQELTVKDEELYNYIAGIVIGNDISARDIQLPQGQYFKGKSYRTFCPLGPYLCLLDKEDMGVINDLRLTLSVNGEVRQSGNTKDLLYKPLQTIQELSQFCDLSSGDVILTGTPGGTAVKAPKSKLLLFISRLLPEATKWKLMVKKQLRNPNYLKPGDRLTASIRTDNGQVDLGVQENLIAEN